VSNTPDGSADNISIGNAIVYIGDQGETPSDDVGYLSDDGVTVKYETETVDVSSGFPKTSIRQFVTSVTVTLGFTSQEWDLTNFSRALIGELTTSSTQEVLGVGVDACPGELTARVQFVMPCVDDTITIDVWRIQSNGALELKFDGSNAHVFPYEFKALLATETWAGDSLDANVGLFQITRELAA
jgi:hypothetical protein